VTYEQLIHDLWALGHAKGMRLGLDAVQSAAERLGRPNQAYPAVHVAGTNGKGSVAHIAARLLAANGLCAGLTTSPHLHRLTERIRVAGREVERDELAQVAGEMAERLGGRLDAELTFFEIVTLLAFDVFRRRAVDAAVVEVGLGGRLDASRLCRPVVSVVTSIGLDHTEQLGTTLAAIAGEKAGILVPGVPVVLGPLEPEARDVVLGRARELGCPALRWDAGRRVFLPADGGTDAEAIAREASGLLFAPPLPGAHQLANTALAVAAVVVALRALGRPIDPSRMALAPFVLPGRLESIPGSPPVLLDVAHNPHGAASLAAYIDGERLRPRFVLGMLGTKDVEGLARVLGRPDRCLHACAPALPGTHAPERVAAAWPGPRRVHESVHEALAAALAAAREQRETVVVTGSHYTVAEARAELLGITDVDRPIAL
jgi:dihydrofolate synthase/folylpolyglutamate synthase